MAFDESDDRCRIVGTGQEPQTHWRSIYVAAALSFVGAVQFSLYFSALWPYMRKIDDTITEGFFGVTVAVYSLGQIISAPLFGSWSNRIKEVRLPLTAGLALMAGGNIVYLLMENVGFVQKRYVLLLCRFIVGLGSGNVALLRSYASTASHKLDRSRAIAFVTCGQAVGMTLGPAFQLFFTPFKYPGLRLFGLFHLNLYTLPAYLACVINFLGVIALYRLFEETYIDLVDEDKNDGENESEDAELAIQNQNQLKNILPMYDVGAVLICFATRFVDMFSRTNLETLGSPYSMMMFSLAEHAAVRTVSLAQGMVGALTLIIYLSYIFGNLEQYVHFRLGCIVSLVMMFLFHFLTFSWPFLPNYVDQYNFNETMNATSPVGCNADRFEWCGNLTAVNIWFFYISYVVLIGIAFPILTITLTTLFSKILGPRRQGTEQGLFQSSSAAARMIAPIMNTVLYTYYGPRSVWVLEMAVIACVIVSWFIFYNRMVDLKIPIESTSQNAQVFGYQNPQFQNESDEENEI